MWTSPDLSSGSWVNHGVAIHTDERPVGVVFRPHVTFAPNLGPAGTYVLYWNYKLQKGPYVGTAVAHSASPYGPFKLVSKALNVTRPPGGDFVPFTDDAGVGYIAYSSAHLMSIER